MWLFMCEISKLSPKSFIKLKLDLFLREFMNATSLEKSKARLDTAWSNLG